MPRKRADPKKRTDYKKLANVVKSLSTTTLSDRASRHIRPASGGGGPLDSKRHYYMSSDTDEDDPKRPRGNSWTPPPEPTSPATGTGATLPPGNSM